MFRNDPDSGLVPEDDTMTRSDYQLWSPTELASNGVCDMQYFGADEALFEASDALEYGDAVLKGIDTECREPFNADDIIDSCMNHGGESARNANGSIMNHEIVEDVPADGERQVKIELPSDPASVLQSLSTMLDSAGGVDMKDSFFVKIMESSTMMPVQCILINILRATNKSTLKRLLGGGMWAILHGWLLDARSQNNKPLMLEILQLCKLMPVNTKLLKSNTCAKDIKHLIKHNDERISRLAKVIVDDWVTIVTGVKSGASKTADQKNRKAEATKEAVLPPPQEPVPSETAPESDSKLPSDGDSRATDVKERPRPKTVKALPIKFRSTGLECVEAESNTKPHAKAAEKNLSQKPISASTSVSSFLNKTAVATSQPAKQSKIKLIPARPLQPELSEKSAFLDALKGPSSAPIRRKRKVPTSPTSKQVPSVTSELKKDEIAAALKNAAQSVTSEPQILTNELPELPATENEEVSSKRAKTKKTVSWAADNDLCDYFYFEVDPDERINVNKIQSSSDFNDHRRHEIEMERKALVGMCHSSKKGLCYMEWRCPPPIDERPPAPGEEHKTPFVPGSESTEKFFQLEREAKVLQVIYFSHDSVPESPSEPDEESVGQSRGECKIIPLDDEEEPMEVETSSELINTTKSTASLPPILSNLFGNLINQSPNVEVNATASPVIVEAENNFPPTSYMPHDDGRLNFNQPPNHQMHQDMGSNFNQAPRNDFNVPMQPYANHRDRYSHPEEYHGRYRARGPVQPFHQNDFRGRAVGPRHGGFGGGGQLCQFFMAGNCRFGTNCRNLHPR